MKNKTISEQEQIVKYQNKLKTIFRFENNNKEINNENLNVVNINNTILFVPISQIGKMALLPFTNEGINNKDITLERTFIQKVGVSSDYLFKVLNVLKEKKTVKITTSQDAPIEIENEDFKVYIAYILLVE